MKISNNVLKIIFVNIFLFSVLQLNADTWRVFFYMDCSDGLSDMAIKNITDMVRGKPNDNVEFLLQVHAFNDVALRYKITQSGLVFLQETKMTGISKEDFILASQWAFDKCRTDHTMIIFSNHGWGILDPYWDDEKNRWQTSTYDINDECVIKKIYFEDFEPKEGKCACCEHINHKGFMFNANPRVYLNNQDLIESLDFISNKLLNGKKVDVLAFDTCMGGMFELAYQFWPYANYLVGCQSCSLKDGFNYIGCMDVLNRGLQPREIVAGMVKAFESYYFENDKSGIYTHAALDLSCTEDVKVAIDSIILRLLKIPNASEIILNAREQAPRFCMWKVYTDPVAFFKIVEKQIYVLPDSYEKTSAMKALNNFYLQAEKIIVARCGGFRTEGKAYGFAIYLPPAKMIEDSYINTLFAKNSQWLNLLKQICEIN